MATILIWVSKFYDNIQEIEKEKKPSALKSLRLKKKGLAFFFLHSNLKKWHYQRHQPTDMDWLGW